MPPSAPGINGLEFRWRGILLLSALGVVMLMLTAIAATLTGARFSLMFHDIPDNLWVILFCFAFFGAVWDGLLLAADGWAHAQGKTGETASRWARYGFFCLGGWPMAFILVTTYGILLTSNVTLVNLQLVSATTMEWKDALFWKIEGGILSRIHMLTLPVISLDIVYHGVWAYWAFCTFMMLVLGRDLRWLIYFSISLLVLFFAGRALGLAIPVQGPAFFRPDMYPHLQGSMSLPVMEVISRVMQHNPKETSFSAVLIGGISALPSLHMGIYTTVVYWLAMVRKGSLAITLPWTLIAWSCTILLGWHYMVDGVGGIALAACIIWLTRKLVPLCGIPLPTPFPAANKPHG